MRWQIIDQHLHGATDYTVGATLMTVFPRLAQLSGTRAARQIRVAGAAHVGYSVFTDYRLGAVKVIPYKAHLALDAVGALALAAAPFVSGEFTRGRRHWAPQVGLCLFELASLALTDPSGLGASHGDPEAVRRANRLQPSAAIRSGGVAVKAGSAVR